MRAHIHTHTHTNAHAYMHTHTNLCTRTQTRTQCLTQNTGRIHTSRACHGQPGCCYKQPLGGSSEGHHGLVSRGQLVLDTCWYVTPPGT